MTPSITVQQDLGNRIAALRDLSDWIDDNAEQLNQFAKLRLTPCGGFLTCEVPEGGLDMAALPALDFGPHKSDAWPAQLRAAISGTEVVLVVGHAERLRCQKEVV